MPYVNADTSSRMAADIHTLLWTAGALRCVLTARHQPLVIYAVQVFRGKTPILSERVSDPDHGSIVAERLWTTFVDSAS